MADPQAQQWQTRLGGAPGERVEGIEELEQSLRVILESEVGSVPGRSSFGIRREQILDAPLDYVRALASREVVRAVRESDPRIEVVAVIPVGGTEDGRLPCEVHWQPAGQALAEPRVTRAAL